MKVGLPSMGYVRWEQQRRGRRTCSSRERRRPTSTADGAAPAATNTPAASRPADSRDGRGDSRVGRQRHGVTQRYGKTVALDDISIDIPANRTGRADRARRGRQVDAARGQLQSVPQVSPAKSLRAGRRYPPGRSSATRSPRVSPTAAGDSGKNLYPTLSIFENIDFFGHLFGRSRTTQWRISTSAGQHRPDAVRERPTGKLIWRHETEAGGLLLVDPRPRSPDPRRIRPPESTRWRWRQFGS